MALRPGTTPGSLNPKPSLEAGPVTATSLGINLILHKHAAAIFQKDSSNDSNNSNNSDISSNSGIVIIVFRSKPTRSVVFGSAFKDGIVD